MPALRPVIGERFGRLTVLEPIRVPGKRLQYRCACECGSEHVTRAEYLNRGEVSSCGCARRDSARAMNARRWAGHEYSMSPRAVRRRKQRQAERERVEPPKQPKVAPRQDSVRTMQWPPVGAVEVSA